MRKRDGTTMSKEGNPQKTWKERTYYPLTPEMEAESERRSEKRLTLSLVKKGAVTPEQAIAVGILTEDDLKELE